MKSDRIYEEAEIRARLQQELPGWLYEGGYIQRVYVTADWNAAVALVNRISPLAEAAWHHPDIEFRFGRVLVRLMTHSAGGITEKDFDLANNIELLLAGR